MEIHTWLLFIVASIGLSVSPGPNGLLALAHGATHGPRKTINTILGGTVGFTSIMALSMFGIGAVLQASIVWLVVLKLLGGAYLVYLGIQLWLSPPINLKSSRTSVSVSQSTMFKQGFLAAVTNPKVLLFFAAFLPQFITPNSSLILQFVTMASTFAVIEIIAEYVIASMANRLRPWLNQAGKRFNQACGGAFICIGVALPLNS
jgi:homoserine/homoserine lactone efflux protein